MLTKEDKSFLELYSDSEYDKPSVTTDAVIFRLASNEVGNYRKLPEKKLQVLLLKRKYPPFVNKYAIPGTFIDLNFELSETMRLCVKKKVGLEKFYFEQLFTFGEKSRDPRTRVLSTSYMLLTTEDEKVTDGEWFDVEIEDGEVEVRVVNNVITQTKTVNLTLKNGKTTLTNKLIITLKKGDEGEVKNVEIKSTNLAFDHAKIIFYAIERLKNKLEYTDIIFNLIPKKFTLTELKLCYEKILGVKLLDANFRRKTAKLVEPTKEYEQGKGYRSSRYYTRTSSFDFNNLE